MQGKVVKVLLGGIATVKSVHELLAAAQQTHNVATTSLQRRCNVTRRCSDVVGTLCVCWCAYIASVLSSRKHAYSNI